MNSEEIKLDDPWIHDTFIPSSKKGGEIIESRIIMLHLLSAIYDHICVLKRSNDIEALR